MEIQLKSMTNAAAVVTQCLVIPIFGRGPGDAEEALDQATSGLLTELRRRGDLPGKVGDTLLLPAPAGVKAQRVLLVSAGDDALSPADFGKLSSATYSRLREMKVKDASLLFDSISVADRDAAWALTQLAMAAELCSYHYTETVSKPKPAPTLQQVTLASDDTAEQHRAVAHGVAIGQGMNMARRLGDLPANYCTPTILAEQARALTTHHDRLQVEVLEEEAMHELGMGALLSVTAGSEQPAKLIVVQYQGGKPEQAPQVLVGKGITFDTGGISLKPGAKMDEMKYDMCGAASVLGTLHAIAELALPINVVGIIAAAENMPSGRATRPSDVVTSLSGQTIEILNTDAEGRLVLCDALTYAERFKPAAVIDIATLTGACVVALGQHASAVYSNQDELAEALLAAGTLIGDRGWHMPLWDDYQKQLDSDFADMANVGGPEGGSITAACFLSRFTKAYPWAHLDIAGTAWRSGAKKAATGRPVAMLTQYLAKLAE